jgi:hypothetical protein
MRQKILSISYTEGKKMGFSKRDTALSKEECGREKTVHDEQACEEADDETTLRKTRLF